MEIFTDLEPLLRAFWFIAIPTSVIFIFQTVTTFVGIDAFEGMDSDLDGAMDAGDSPFQVFSLRNLINFLLGFSWTGISFYSSINNTPLLIGISLAIGLLFVFLFFIVIKQIQKLAEDDSFRMENTLNKSAEVYLSIPEKKSGKGKIMISVKGSYHELEAMTENERIPTGAVVKVVKIESGNVLIVETI